MEQTSEEAERWAAALAGSSEAFTWLFDLHRDRVYRQALRMLGSVHDAEDVTAAAFLELWRRRDDVSLPHSEPSRGAGEVAEERLEVASEERKVRAQVALGPRRPLIAITAAFEGFSPSEAASALGISEGAARTRLHRARAHLASVLASSFAEFLTTGPEEGAR